MMSDTAPPGPIPSAEDDESPPGPNEGVLSWPDVDAGDKRIKWEKGNPKSEAKARAKFEELSKKGYAFFRLGVQTAPTFDPEKGTELVATKRPEAKRALPPPNGFVPVPAGVQVRKFEPDDTREIHAVPARRGG